MERKTLKKLLTILRWAIAFAIDNGVNAAHKDGISLEDLRKVYSWTCRSITALNVRPSIIDPEVTAPIDFEGGELPDPRGDDGVVVSSGEPDDHIFYEDPEGRLNA